jgi:two-component system response regulator AtoC
VELVVPPLREHREDIPALVEEFARRCRERFGAEDVRLSRELVGALARAEWPGNVRQLENAVARLVALAPPGVVGLSAWQDAVPAPPSSPEGSSVPPQQARESGAVDDATPPDGSLSLREHLEAVERGFIARTLAASGGNQSEAARRLGLSRSALIDRLKKYGLSS